MLFHPASNAESGLYTLQVEDTMHCKKSQTVELSITPAPVIAFAPYDTLWVEPGFLLDAGNDAASYLWNTGESTSTIVIDSIGVYKVLATSTQDCKSTDAVQILWAGTPFYLPNAFTPNGDGLNDVFGAIPRYDYVRKYRLSIYNRWGQKLFESIDINNGWDGTYKGTLCPTGVYVYRINYEEFGQQTGKDRVKEGTMSLLR